MYAYIKGVVTKVTPKYIVLENNDIGYLLIVTNPYSYKLNQNYLIYTYQHIKEDCNDIYGFLTEEEKVLFLQLINVTGIGPKSALSILASGTVNDICLAINESNITYLKKFPGIGAKASQQIVLDLKGKVNFDGHVVIDNSKLDDVSEALQALGYNKKEITKIVNKLDSNLDISILIKQALKEINK